jgi:hypothetical protein
MENLTTLSGVQPAVYKDGSTYYRASITHKGKHIALGSYDNPMMAHAAYLEARGIIENSAWELKDWKKDYALSFQKCVILVNFRDQGVYIGTPILLKKDFFLYYLSYNDILTFDIDDLFYYSSHSIMRRGSHLFVADYGSQISIYSRYGIPPYAVAGRDYRFINSDPTDLRYQNIEIINRYRGVRMYTEKGFQRYKAVIHIRSSYVIGHYNTEYEAAIAYNKAADILLKKGVKKKYELNYIEDLSPKDYADIYTRVKISKRIQKYNEMEVR